MHAHCQVETSLLASCQETYTAIQQVLNSSQDAYELFDSHLANEMQSSNAASFIWAKRRTPLKKFITDMMFSFDTMPADSVRSQVVENGASLCKVSAKSRLTSVSYFDYGVNFCFLFNVVNGTGIRFAPFRAVDCYSVPENPMKACINNWMNSNSKICAHSGEPLKLCILILMVNRLLEDRNSICIINKHMFRWNKIHKT